MPRLRDEVDAVAAANGFSGVVRVDRGDEIELARAYGLADRAHEIPNALDTQFATASATKGLTALTVVSLIEEGVLELSTTARSVLCDDLVVLPVAVFAGSLCAQAHVAYVGLVVGLSALVLGTLAARVRRSDRVVRRDRFNALRVTLKPAVSFCELAGLVRSSLLCRGPGQPAVRSSRWPGRRSRWRRSPGCSPGVTASTRSGRPPPSPSAATPAGRPARVAGSR